MLTQLIDFLMNLLGDKDAKEAFDKNPEGELNKAGLGGVTGQDVRDARLIMADNGGVRPRSGDHRPSHDNDPVREIHHTTREYIVEKPVQHVEQNINIDDRDITIIDDSFNSDDDTEVNSVAVQDNDTNVTQVKDSFNDVPKDDDVPDETPKPEPVEEPDAGTPLEPEPVEQDPEIVLDDPALEPAVEPEPEPAHQPELDHEPVVEHDPVIA